MAGQNSFGGFLKQSTAVTIEIGPFIDATGVGAAQTGLTITPSECKLSKNGGSLAAKNESTNLSHDANGMYKVLLDTTDTNTVGILTVIPADTAVGHQPFSVNYMVLPANVYDSLIGGTDDLQVDLEEIGGSAVSTTTAQLGVNVVSVKDDAITAAGIATGAIAADGLATDAVTEIVDAIVAAFQARIDSGAVAAGASGSVTLGSSASSTNDVYKIVIVRSPTGVVQVAEVTAYNGTTKVATITPNWGTVPDTTYQYIAIGG